MKPILKTEKLYTILIIILLIITSIVFYKIIFTTPFEHWGGDYVAYIAQAESIITNTVDKYISINTFILSDGTSTVAPVLYPWGFPILLIPSYLLGNTLNSYLAVSYLSVLSFIYILLISNKKILKPIPLIALASFFVLNHPFQRYTNQILSDLPFLTISVMTIYLINTWVVKDFKSLDWKRLTVLSLLIFVAYQIRSSGLFLLAALISAQIFETIKNNSKKKSFKIYLLNSIKIIKENLYSLFLPLGIVLILIILMSLTITTSESKQFSLLNSVSIDSIKMMLRYYILIPQQFFNSLTYGSIIFGITIPLTFIGITKRLKNEYPTIIYILLTIILLIVWPYKAGLRFLLPIFPFYISYALSGLQTLVEKYSKQIQFLFTSVPLILIIGLLSFQTLEKIRALPIEPQTGPYTEEAQEMFNWIEKSTDENSILLFYKPRVLYSITNRLSIITNRIEHLEDGDFIILSNETRSLSQYSLKNIEILLEKKRLNILYSNDTYTIYKIIKD